MSTFFRKLKWLAERRRKETELRDELQFHLEEEAEQKQAEGWEEQEARLAARRDLGNLSQLREDTRSVWGWTMVEQLGQDLRYAFRSMSANKLVTSLAVLSLALGIGANTAIYSFMDAILLRSLPVQDPASLVVLNWHAKQVGKWGSFVMHAMSGSTYDDPKTGTTGGIFPYPAFALFEKDDSIFSSVFAYHVARDLNVIYKGQANLTNGEYVSGEYFRGLKVPPAAGRLLIEDDDHAGATPVVVVSFAFSQRHMGGAENAPGQPLLVNNIPFVVAGVTAPGFFGVDPAAAPDVYLPMHANLSDAADRSLGPAKEYLDKNYYWIEMMGRLRPGISLVQAHAVLAPQFHQWVASTASNDLERANLPALVVEPGAAGLDSLRRQYSRPLYVLMTLVALILAIACANVANLLLARASARRREIALRLSVGAGRFRVVRQLLTESILLASLGGAFGILLAVLGIRFLMLLLANGSATFTLQADLNWRVLAVAVALSLLTGVLFGLAPALQSTRVDVISAMKELRASSSGGRGALRRFGLSHVLIVGQIAVSLLMLVAAGLFVRTLTNLQSLELGFNRENLLLFDLDARKAGHKDPEITAFYGDLLKRLGAIPGVRDASLSNQSLMRAGYGLGVRIHGKPGADANRMLVVSPGFLKAMQIPIVAGRDIDERDQPGSPPVAVVSEYFAKLNFGDENPLGRHVVIWSSRGGTSSERDMEVVGISKNVRYGGLKDKARPVLYVPYHQGFPKPQRMVFELRTSGNPLQYVNTVREIVHQADSLVPLANVKSQVMEIDESINQEIVFAELCTAFAILALVIACVGLYGTVSYNVARRTGEIGIRMALGAPRARVVRMILRQVLVLAGVGLAIGFPAALGTSKLVQSFLYGMKANDPLAIAAAVAILLAAAGLAGYAPARRASRIDPMVALRHE